MGYYEISNADTKMYESVVQHIVQQSESRIRDKVTIKRFNSNERLYMNYLGSIDPIAIVGDFAETVYQAIDHKRRMINHLPYAITLPLSWQTEIRTVVDFASPYVEAQRMGLNRKIDTLILAALRGTAYETITDGDTLNAVTFPAGQKIAHVSSDLTVEKLILTQELFTENEIPADWAKYMAVAPKQVSALMREVEVTSRDFNYNNELAPLRSGKIATFMGINFIPFSSSMIYTDATYRYCYCWAAQGIGLGISKDAQVFIDRLPARYQARQFQTLFAMGAARLQEKCVVEVACLEA